MGTLIFSIAFILFGVYTSLKFLLYTQITLSSLETPRLMTVRERAEWNTLTILNRGKVTINEFNPDYAASQYHKQHCTLNLTELKEFIDVSRETLDWYKSKNYHMT